MAGNNNSGRKKQKETMTTVYIKLPPADVVSYKKAAKAQGNISLSAYLRMRLEIAKTA